MAGNDGSAERLAGGLDRLEEALGAALEQWAQAPGENAAEADKVAKTGRSFARALGGVADAGWSVNRLRAA